MNSKRKSMGILMGIVLLATLATAFIVPQLKGNDLLPWKLGLDLSGGSVLTYHIDLSNVPQKDQVSVLSGLQKVVEARVNKFGVAEPRVSIAQKGNEYQLLVELAGVRDLKDAVRQIGETPTLDFRELDFENMKGTVDKDGQLTLGEPAWKRTELTGRHIEHAVLSFDTTAANVPIVDLQFNDDGAKLFEEITGRNVGKPLGIFIDDAEFSAPVVNTKISGGKATISGGKGGFSVEEAKQLAERLSAGALSAPITLINQRNVSATAAEGALAAMTLAGIVGTVLVMMFMIIYYRGLGVFASIALLIYIALSFGVFKLFSVTMTLSGIAGLLLSVGMAVDANILIFERTLEERRRGLAKDMALDEGFKRAWTSIRDSNITTIISCLILYYFTSSFVRGFALTLGVGVVVSMFTAIFVTRKLLQVFARSNKAEIKKA